MSEDTPLYGGPTSVITTDDCTLFSCTLYEMGGFKLPRAVRWKIIATDGLEYVGPPYAQHESTPAAVQRLVSEWWESKKVLGQAGQNVQTLRGKLSSDDEYR